MSDYNFIRMTISKSRMSVHGKGFYKNDVTVVDVLTGDVKTCLTPEKVDFLLPSPIDESFLCRCKDNLYLFDQDFNMKKLSNFPVGDVKSPTFFPSGDKIIFYLEKEIYVYNIKEQNMEKFTFHKIESNEVLLFSFSLSGKLSIVDGLKIYIYNEEFVKINEILSSRNIYSPAKFSTNEKKIIYLGLDKIFIRDLENEFKNKTFYYSTFSCRNIVDDFISFNATDKISCVYDIMNEKMYTLEKYYNNFICIPSLKKIVGTNGNDVNIVNFF